MLRWFRPDDLDRLRMLPSTRDLVRTHAADRAAVPSRTVRHGAGAVPHVVGAHLYLEDPVGRVLLGLRHHNSAFAPNTWHFLAGHCEQESAVLCLVREAEEEAGLCIDPRDVEFVHVLHQLPGRAGGHGFSWSSGPVPGRGAGGAGAGQVSRVAVVGPGRPARAGRPVHA